MFADLMNSLPSIKSSIFYIFDTYFGIKLNLANFSLDQDNNLFIQIKDIKLEPNQINNNYLKNINIKITKGIIEQLELRVGINTLELNISKISLTVMPVISINNENREKENEIKNENEINNNNNKEKNEEDKKGIISSFIDYYLSKLKISIEEIELIAFNYELTNKNLDLANPVIFFNIYKIKYEKGKIKESLDKNYIRKNVWENKHFSIGGICLKISKSFTKEEKDINKSELSTNTNKKNLYDIENNDNIMVINTEKGIHFYTNTKNEILGEIGDIQLIINLFQLELFKNFIDCYLTYLSLGQKNDIKIKEIKNENQIFNNKNSNINKSVINNKSNNEIMNLKINLTTLSLIILERNQNPTEVKLNEFIKDKMNEHFCYVEDNFFIFILYNLSIQYNNNKNLYSITLDEICLNYIEYNSKEKKEEEIELVKRTGSQYSDCNDTAIFKGSEVFKSISEDGINVKEYYCSYDYRYNKNQILLIKNIKMEFIKANNKDKNKIIFDMNSFTANFHPIYLFKMLKILYENSFLIKEVLLYNIELIKEEEKFNKGNNKFEENMLIENGNENGNNINLSLSSFESKEEEDSDKNKTKEDNKRQNLSNVIYNSDLIFKTHESIPEPEETINIKIKKFLKSLTFEIKIRVIEIKINSFICEENFYNIINPFFNEFYYEHIFIMDIKEDFKQKKLKINEISSKDYFNIMIKNINIKNITNENNNEFIIIKFHPLILSFSNNKILECYSDTFPFKYDLDKNEININIKINTYFKVKLSPYILSFINIWKYTLLLFDIFKQRMIYNYTKGKNELDQLNYEKDKLDYIQNNRLIKNMNEDDINIDYINNINDTNIINININIPEIKIEFDILTQKIKACTYIKFIELKYTLNKLSSIINFSIKEIISKEFDFSINSISINLNLSEIKIDNNNIIHNNRKTKKNKNIFCDICPVESIEIYIENILRLKQKQKQLDLLNNPKNSETKIDIDIALKEIKIKPLELILFINDIYNVIGREEIYNTNNNEKNRMLLTKSMRRLSSSSSIGSKNTKNKRNILTSLVSSTKSKQDDLNNNKKKITDLININLKIDSIKCTIIDDTTFKSTELCINNITLKKKIFNIKKIDFFILYEIEDFGEKVLVNLSEINEINLSLTEKEKQFFSIQIVINSIKFSICKDSFDYIQNVLDIITNTISDCFVPGKKGNKIVISQKKDVLLGMRDTRLEDEQELELFGDNEAKSVCLISAKNEFDLVIDEDYLDNLKNEKEEVLENIDEIFKSNLREQKAENNENNDLSLCIKKINFGLYAGLDFKSILDIKCKTDENNDKDNENNKNEENIELKINNNNEDDNNDNNSDNQINININEEINKNADNNKNNSKENNFEIIEFNPYKKINGRERDNFLLFCTEELNLSIIYVKANSYEIDFSIKNFEINDHLKESNFKRLLFAQDNIEKNNENNNEEQNNKKFLSIFVDISNSQNKLSTNNYSDFNIICEISVANIQLLIHQNSLLFILNFFIDPNKKENTKENPLYKLYNQYYYHTNRAFIEDCEFNEIIVDDIDGNNQNDLLIDRNFFYITNFLFRKFNVNITYESNELGFSFQSIYIPLIPDLKNYDFSFNEIKYKGFVTLNQFTDFFVEHFLGQLSKSNIIFQLLKSLSWTQPIINIFGDFFDIFISPFQSYKRNQGFIHGLFKGIKKFFFNLLSKNVYVGEKMIRTLTTFIGVTKNNAIGRNSFYERYILTDEKKKIYDYFYK